MSGLPAYALVLSLKYGAGSDGRVLPVEQRLAALRAEQLRGHRFVAYTDYEGSEETIYALAPLGPADEGAQGFEVARDEPARETLQNPGEGLRRGRGFIAEYIPELSNPFGGDRLEPAPYVRLISAVIKPGVAEDIRSAAREAGSKIAAAHRRARGGRHFAVYRSYSGPDEVVHVVIPLAGSEELEGRFDHRELLREAYGADEAARLTYVISQLIVGSTSSVGKRHPSY